MNQATRNVVASSVVACVAAFMLACNVESQSGGAPEAPATVENTRWRLTELNGRPVVLPEGSEDPYIKLDAATRRVEGFTGCNRIMGGYELAGETLSFPGLASSRMYCAATQAVEHSFLAALTATRRFRISGAALELLGDSGSVAKLGRIDEPKAP